MIKKAKRVPEEVEYFVYTKGCGVPESWDNLEKIKNISALDHLFGQSFFEGDYFVRNCHTGQIKVYSPEDFESLFEPLPDE